MVDFFKTGEAIWDVKVQLCVDPEMMPIEDASVEWPEELSPYITVARLVAAPQDANSAARRLYAFPLTLGPHLKRIGRLETSCEPERKHMPLLLNSGMQQTEVRPANLGPSTNCRHS